VTRRGARRLGATRLRRAAARELQPHHRHHDERDARQAHGGAGLTERDDPHERRARGADARPRRIRRADRQVAHREGQEGEARAAQGERQQRRQRPPEAVAEAQRDREPDFQDARQRQQHPRHGAQATARTAAHARCHNPPVAVSSPVWTWQDGQLAAAHGRAQVRFTSRCGGVSAAPYDTLNLGRWTTTIRPRSRRTSHA
jgi:hypothetical protein